MLWLWDLSATLGWAAGGGPVGSWLTRSVPSPRQVRITKVFTPKAGIFRALRNPWKGIEGLFSCYV